MKFTTSKYLTIADLETQEYKDLQRELKETKLKDFQEGICIANIGQKGNKAIINIESVEIVMNHGRIIPWVKLLARDCDNFYEISMNYWNSEDNFTITYGRK